MQIRLKINTPHIENKDYSMWRSLALVIRTTLIYPLPQLVTQLWGKRHPQQPPTTSLSKEWTA